MEKVISLEQAASLIRDEDILAFNAMGWLGNPVLFYEALERRFLQTGAPGNITLYCACGIGGREQPVLANRLAHKGLVRRLIIGHYDSMRSFFPLVRANEVEAYNLPQGMLSQNLHEAARHSPGFFTQIGLHTWVDPRVEGAGLNESSREQLLTVTEVEGEEQLFVKTIYPTACVIRGTTADRAGNITFEKEALLLDALVMAQAVHNRGGRVIVQVERLSDSCANPQMVKIPHQLVDAIYVDPQQMQTGTEVYNALYSGESRAPWSQVSEYMQALLAKGEEMSVKRLAADRIIARRAALELRRGDVVNLGIGIPTSIGLEVNAMGLMDPQALNFTVELGMMGGVPAGEIAFGAVMNADSIYDQAAQFEFYEGGGLDITFVGALEFDRSGNINVIKIGDKFFGLGGFNYVAQTPRRLVVCTKFMQGSGCRRAGDGWSAYDGRGPKLVEQVEHVNFSGEQALGKGQEVLFITERAVFRLTREGVMLTEVAPFVDAERDVLRHLSGSIPVSPELKQMDQRCFDF